MRLGVSPTVVATPYHSPQSTLSLSLPFSQHSPLGPLPCGKFSPSTHLTSLVGLVDCFFNSWVVGVPCSLILWHFWLFIDFRVVVILLSIVRGSEGFLPTPPSWPELPCVILNTINFNYQLDGHCRIQVYPSLHLQMTCTWKLKTPK